MAYDIRKSNNDLGATVDDATINTKFDITLIGKNFSGYGTWQNTNFLHLLENFSHSAQPPKAINGQLWYDNATKRLKINTGTSELKEWHTLSVIESADTAPTNLSIGNFWWDTVNSNLYCRTAASTNELIGGSLTGIATKMKSRIVKDSAAVDRHIIEAVVANQTLFIISNTAFTLHSTINPITGFTDIKQGITASGLNLTTSVSSTFKFWGSATDSERLGGVVASDYISNTNPNFSNSGLTIGTGTTKKLYLYNDTVTGSASLGYPIIENKYSEKIIFKTKGADTNVYTALEINTGDVLPGVASTTDIGSTAKKFRNIHALSFKGTAENADNVTVVLSGVTRYAAANEDAEGGTIVSRTSAVRKFTKISQFSYLDPVNNINYVLPTGELDQLTGDPIYEIVTEDSFAVSASHVASGVVEFGIKNFNGVVTAGYLATLTVGSRIVQLDVGTIAGLEPGFEIVQTSTVGGQFGGLSIPVGSIYGKYFIGVVSSTMGDVAEKYLADATYDEGTVLMVGGVKEVTAAQYSNRALGVVSTKPAVMMNADLVDGTFVALKGRVPVKVIGTVKKGDRLVAADTGVAKVLESLDDASLVFAIALTDNHNDIVEAVIL